jgi:6-phosphogluconate dehydrogenase
MEISASILKTRDDETLNGLLIDKIADNAGAKGTGKWSVQNAADVRNLTFI